MEPYFGLKYKWEGEEYFDELLIFLDIGYVQRKIAANLKPEQGVEDNGDGTYTIDFSTMILTYRVVFTPGVEFNETKPDGVTVRALITFKGNTISHSQREDNGRTLHHIYEFTPDAMTITTTAKGLNKVVKRYYKLKNDDQNDGHSNSHNKAKAKPKFNIRVKETAKLM